MPNILTGPATPDMHRLAIPAACALVGFLGYSSQWLFNRAADLDLDRDRDPGPLTRTETVVFNGLLGCLWLTYWRACTTDPGGYPMQVEPPRESRWCKKCRAPKPPRAHHCRHCRRCVPKMDHHCPWTGNCVSLQTFPHFVRFVVFANLSLWALGALLAPRLAALWAQRRLPAYLGPTLPQLVHLTLLALVGAAAALALALMLWTTLQAWLANTTMIESWEVDRHEALLARYRRTAVDGTWWDASDSSSSSSSGSTHVVRRVEFPYDLGFFANMAQAMGTRNVFLWLWPLAGGPRVAPGGVGVGWDWPENGLNDRLGLWPPPDPEKTRQAVRSRPLLDTTQNEDDNGLVPPPGWQTGTPAEQKAAFAARQAADFSLRRRVGTGGWAEQQAGASADCDDVLGFEQGLDSTPGWANADGDRLRDYGVDEEEEDDDVPLGELIRRNKLA